MQEFIKRFDALPDETKNEIYKRIAWAADTLPPVSDIKAHNAAVKAIAENYLNER